MSETVYVARRSCGCIVAAFPLNIDKGVKGELLKQFAKIGLDVDQTSGADVRLNFNLSCTHGAPPLITLMEQAAAEKDTGIEQNDVDSAGPEDLTPDGSADALLDATAEQATDESAAPLEAENTEAPATEAEAEEPDPITAPPAYEPTDELVAEGMPGESDGREMAPEPHKEKKQRHNQ
jgi:hypothetical protein